MKLLQYLAVPYGSQDDHGGAHLQDFYSPLVNTAEIQPNIFNTSTTTTERSFQGFESYVTMDLLGALGSYINPFSCPISVFETRVLENYWLCCPFWYMNDFIMSIIEGECGIGDVNTIETYREMVVPLMRERCPADQKDSIGCSNFYHIIRFLLVIFIFGMFFITTWATVITIKYYRIRKQLQNSRGHLLKNLSSVEKKKMAQDFTKPSTLQVELRPLTNGIKNHALIV